jgi:opacity protein-like surface antigen
MNRKSLIALFSLVVLLCARPILAQTPASPRPAAQPASPTAPIHVHRLFIDGVGGVTFDHAAGGIFGAGVTAVASKHVQFLGEAGRLTNVLPKATAANLNTVAASFVANGTTPFLFSAKRPGYYGLGEVRITSAMSKSGLAPFVEAGAGFAHVTSKISAQGGGEDMTDAFLAAIAPLPTETKPMLTGGAGLRIKAGRRSVVDLGYRYGRILTDAPAIPTNRLYAAIRIGV